MLAHEEHAQEFSQEPALQLPPGIWLPNSDLTIGLTIGRDRILSLVRAGGIGIVHRARFALGRHGALKLVSMEFSGMGKH